MELFGSNLFSFGRKREMNATPTPPSNVPGVPSSTVEKEHVKGGSFEERIVRVRANDPRKALTVAAVYRATELRAKTIGQMPVQYQKKDDIGGNFTPWLYGLGKRMNYLLQEEPNPLMSGPSLWEQVTIQRLMWGNGFVYIERDAFGDPVHFWLADCGGYNYGNDTYSITYMTNYGPMAKDNVKPQDILHFPNTFRYNDYAFWGKSVIRYAADTLSLIKTESQLALETAAKGGRVKGFISEDRTQSPQGTMASGRFNQNEVSKFEQEINKKVYDLDINVLQNFEKFQNLSLSAQDMQMVEQLNLSLDDVARFWGVPRPLLMLDTNSHYNDYANATMEFMSRTIGPDKTDMEKEIARKLLGVKFYGTRRIHICEKPLLAMDPERQAKVDKMHLEAGVKTVNELRGEHDMPAVENGDEPLASANLLTLKALLAKSAPEPGRPTTETAKEGEEK
jgi:HK97 family phage portal protein